MFSNTFPNDLTVQDLVFTRKSTQATQMESPLESHREYPVSIPAVLAKCNDHMRALCDKDCVGWFPFSQQDVGKTVSLEGSTKILVDGALCTKSNRVLGISLGQPCAFIWFRCKVEHPSEAEMYVKRFCVSTCLFVAAGFSPTCHTLELHV